MKYLIPALRDMHHHRFAYLLLSDSSGWQGQWQLTHINPAAQHELSLHSRNPSLVFKHRGGVLGPDTKHRQHLHCKVDTARVSWRGGSPGRTLSPSGASSSGTGPWAAQHQGYTQGLLCPHCWPAHMLMDQNEREVWTNITCLGCGSLYWSFSIAAQQDRALTHPLKAAGGVKAPQGALLQMELCGCNWTWLLLLV